MRTSCLAAIALGAALLGFSFERMTGPAAGGALVASRDGGTMRVNMSASDIQSVDPGIDYEFLGWQIEYATCVKLLNYPDEAGAAGTILVPEVAASLPQVSANGRVYSFAIRKGYRFNTGEEVTAQTFAHVFNRVLSPKLQSPASVFVHDILGADAVLSGKTKTASGIRAVGSTLSITLSKVAPDFLARVAMNFFCAVPLDYPTISNNQKPPAAAGPYYISRRVPNRVIELKRNPMYAGRRPHHVDTFLINVGGNLSQSLLQVKAGKVDYDMTGLPAQSHAQLAKQFGINKSRYFVNPIVETDYLPLNASRPLFRNASMRKAVNYAVDRPALIRQLGYLAGEPTDQILPPSMRGFRDAKLYPVARPDLVKAKRLAAGQTGTAQLYIPSGLPAAVAQASIIQANLAQIGIKVTVKQFAFGVLVSKISARDEPFDIVLIGWQADYPDPYDFVNILLDGRNILEQNNNNLAHFNDPQFNARMTAAAKMSGAARYEAYGKLDVDMMREGAPWAPIGTRTVRDFVSARVGCYVFPPALGAMDLASACLKS